MQFLIIQWKKFKEYNPSSTLYFNIYKDYIGNCTSSLIAIDSLLQTASISFNVEVLKWPQENWKYWNGPEIEDWLECVKGYVMSSFNNKWVIAEVYFDRWFIIAFAIIVLLITFFTDHELNASYLLLESITFYWILFYSFKNKASHIKQYFEQLKLIVTHFNSLFFPIYNYFVSTNLENQITSSFTLNWVSIIVIISIFSVLWYLKFKSNISHKMHSFFSVKKFSKYFHWASSYLLFWAFYEIFGFDNQFDFLLLSYIITFIALIMLFIFSYWFIIYPFQNWWIWSKFFIFEKIRKEFIQIDNLKKTNYMLIIRYNFIKKVIVTFIIALEIRIGTSPFSFTFFIIVTQTIYSNVIIGLYQFNSAITRGLFIFNEITIVIVVYVSFTEYLNEEFESNSELNKVFVIWLVIIRIYIFLLSLQSNVNVKVDEFINH